MAERITTTGSNSSPHKGDAIDLAYSDSYGAVSRISFDLDFSIAGGDFQVDLETIMARIKRTLVQTYALCPVQSMRG